jgi:hypothetical protein
MPIRRDNRGRFASTGGKGGRTARVQSDIKKQEKKGLKSREQGMASLARRTQDSWVKQSRLRESQKARDQGKLTERLRRSALRKGSMRGGGSAKLRSV